MSSTPWAVSASECHAAQILQSIVRCTDGTVTEILAAWASETIGVQTLEQRRIAWPARSQERAADFSDRVVDALGVDRGESIVLRTSVLRGVDTGAPYLYARTAIVPRRLCAPLRSELDEGAAPIGRLLLEHRVETIRDILEAGVQRAGAAARLLGVHEDETLLTRTYRIVIDGRPAMLITEKLPTVRVFHEPAPATREAAVSAPSALVEGSRARGSHRTQPDASRGSTSAPA